MFLNTEIVTNLLSVPATCCSLMKIVQIAMYFKLDRIIYSKGQDPVTLQPETC